MSKKDIRTPEERELELRIEYANAREARLDETLTRREVLEAVVLVKNQYSLFHHSAFIELLDRLETALS